MKVCTIPDLAIEALLSNIRLHVLANRDQIHWDTLHVHFLSHLALQCFNNEYIYYENNTETKEISTLETEVDQSVHAGQAPALVSVLCLACYKPIFHYSWARTLNFLEELPEIKQMLIDEPLRELELQSEISVLSPPIMMFPLSLGTNMRLILILAGSTCRHYSVLPLLVPLSTVFHCN